MVQDYLSYMYGLERFGIKLGLEVMQQLMELLGHPEKRFKSIHITGTNGKGSTTVFLATILQEAGYKVGMYTSPHLITFNERITVNSQQISDEELIVRVKKIKDIADQNNLSLTFFEFSTALAFLYFAEKKVEYAVVEVGMGGRLDATNVLQPEIAIITNIANDHGEYLGKTLLKIAGEKAGIIKENSMVITGEKKKNIIDLFKEVCNEKKAVLRVLHQEVRYHQEKNDYSAHSLSGQQFTIKIEGKMRASLFIQLLGKHQIQNASLAAYAAQQLSVPCAAITSGLAKARWLGRIQVMQREPLCIVDGAHNLAGMKTLVSFIKNLPRRKVLLLGIAHDKPISEMVHLIAPLFERIIVSKGNFKPAEPEIIAQEAQKYCTAVEIVPEPEKALQRALCLAENEDLVLATGSLYFVGEMIKNFKKY